MSTKENNRRLEILYKKHNEWLRQVSWNLCGDVDMVDDLVGELYLYLSEKGNEKIYYQDSFNLGYCNSFLKSRFYNRIKVENRFSDYEVNENIPEEVYDTEFDKRLEDTYQEIKDLIKSKQKTNDWASAKIAELYYFGKGFTIEGLAEHIGVSKSTVFLHIKKIRKEINNKLQNPFEDNEEE